MSELTELEPVDLVEVEPDPIEWPAEPDEEGEVSC